MSKRLAAKTTAASEDTINSAIRAEMARRRVTQGTLAEGLGISQAQVSARLNGSVDWRWPEVRAVSRILGIALPELVRDAA